MAKQNNHILYSFIFLIPISLYLLMVFCLTVNIPRWDDYIIFLGYLNTPNNERFYQLFSQHNEHRLVFNKMVAELLYQTLGYIDFRYLVIIGNSLFIALFYIIYHLFKKINIDKIYFLPIPYLFFLSYIWENATWATGALQNYAVLLFSILSLIYFSKNNLISLVISLLFATISCFTSGSGLFVVIVLVLWSTINAFETSEENNIINNNFLLKKINPLIRLSVILVVSFSLFYFYFHNYIKPPNHPKILDALKNPVNTLFYYFVFLGSYMHFIYASLLGGIVSSSIFVYLTYKKYYNRVPVIYFYTLFLFLNAIAASITRSGFGVEQAISSRYTIVSVLILIFLYIAIIEMAILKPFFKMKFQYIAFYILFIISLFSYVRQVYTLSKNKNDLISGVLKWKNTGVGLDFPNQNDANNLIKRAAEKGYYKLPDPNEKE
jgi:hypothetical protein